MLPTDDLPLRFILLILICLYWCCSVFIDLIGIVQSISDDFICKNSISCDFFIRRHWVCVGLRWLCPYFWLTSLKINLRFIRIKGILLSLKWLLLLYNRVCTFRTRAKCYLERLLLLILLLLLLLLRFRLVLILFSSRLTSRELTLPLLRNLRILTPKRIFEVNAHQGNFRWWLPFISNHHWLLSNELLQLLLLFHVLFRKPIFWNSTVL
jgi:hypothetical protein